MDRQVSLPRRRWAETAGWLRVRVRHSTGQEGPGEGGDSARRFTRLRGRAPPCSGEQLHPWGGVGGAQTV